MYRKGVVITIIFLFVGISILPATESILLEKSTVSTLDGNTLYVGGSGPGNYSSIQDAIDNASTDDTVFVYDDSSPYYEHVSVNKAITLKGEDKNTTIIDGSKVDDVIYISANGVIISGFTIQNSGDEGWMNGWDGGIDIRTRNCIVSDNKIMYNYYGIVSKDDGRNHTFSYNTFYKNTESAIQLWDDGENNICGNTITYYGGIRIWMESKYNNVSNNLINSSGCGISVTTSHNTISKNTLINTGFYFDAGNNDVFDNTVNGKPLVYLYNEKNQFISENAGQIILQLCDNITIQNQEINNIYVGIQLRDTNNCLISNCTLSNNREAGIYLQDSNDNIISNTSLKSNGWLGAWVWFSSNNMFINNTISKNKIYGIWLHGSSDNTIVSNNIFKNNRECGMCLSEYNRPGYNDIRPNNNIISNNIIKSNNEDGLLLAHTSSNIIRDNNISNNGKSGIYLLYSGSNIITENIISNNHHDGVSLITGSSRNTISGNNITHNNQFGVCSIESFSNIIYHNNFISNIAEHAYEYECDNTWYKYKLIGKSMGNYWDDYEERYPNAGNDGTVWDTPYDIPGGNNQDKYPLINQFSGSQSIPQSTPQSNPSSNPLSNPSSQPNNSQQSSTPLFLQILQRLMNIR